MFPCMHIHSLAHITTHTHTSWIYQLLRFSAKAETQCVVLVAPSCMSGAAQHPNSPTCTSGWRSRRFFWGLLWRRIPNGDWYCTKKNKTLEIQPYSTNSSSQTIGIWTGYGGLWNPIFHVGMHRKMVTSHSTATWHLNFTRAAFF